MPPSGGATFDEDCRRRSHRRTRLLIEDENEDDEENDFQRSFSCSFGSPRAMKIIPLHGTGAGVGCREPGGPAPEG